MVKITEADIYHTLSYHVGKSVLEIIEELAEENGTEHRGKRGIELFAAFVRGPSYGVVKDHLDHLIEQGFARFQERILSQEQLALRSGASQREYFLTSNGIKNRNKYERQEDLGYGGEFEPA